jgi:hypothetical protein
LARAVDKDEILDTFVSGLDGSDKRITAKELKNESHEQRSIAEEDLD